MLTLVDAFIAVDRRCWAKVPGHIHFNKLFSWMLCMVNAIWMTSRLFKWNSSKYQGKIILLIWQCLFKYRWKDALAFCKLFEMLSFNICFFTYNYLNSIIMRWRVFFSSVFKCFSFYLMCRHSLVWQFFILKLKKSSTFSIHSLMHVKINSEDDWSPYKVQVSMGVKSRVVLTWHLALKVWKLKILYGLFEQNKLK